MVTNKKYCQTAFRYPVVHDRPGAHHVLPRLCHGRSGPTGKFQNPAVHTVWLKLKIIFQDLGSIGSRSFRGPGRALRCLLCVVRTFMLALLCFVSHLFEYVFTFSPAACKVWDILKLFFSGSWVVRESLVRCGGNLKLFSSEPDPGDPSRSPGPAPHVNFHETFAP